jgi:hypothetical protein
VGEACSCVWVSDEGGPRMVHSMGRNLDDHRPERKGKAEPRLGKGSAILPKQGDSFRTTKKLLTVDPLPIRFHLHFLCLAASVKNTVRLTIVDDEPIHHLREEFLYSRNAQPSLSLAVSALQIT